jgi:hypothetical protein
MPTPARPPRLNITPSTTTTGTSRIVFGDRKRLGSIGDPIPFTTTRPSAHLRNPMSSTLMPSPRNKEMAHGNDKTRRMVGWGLLVATMVYFGFNMFTLVVSKWILKENVGILKLIAEDTHYSVLIPLLGPVFCFWALLNWLGMKYFRHNV